VRRALFRGDADPGEADDEQDLGERQVGEAELLLEDAAVAAMRSSSR
jgi:hypothetical protein